MHVAPTVERQLFSNQLWETVGFIAKAAFMVGLTPWMITVWGAPGYGEFALASSTFVLLSIVDLGIRARTRLALCGSVAGDRSTWAGILSHSVLTFTVVGAVTIAGAFILTFGGVFERFFNIASADRYLLPLTTIVSILYMLSGLLLEPLIALGQIGKLKLANAVGWISAFPTVAAVLSVHGSVTQAVAAWLACLLLANLGLFLTHLSVLEGAGPVGRRFQLRTVLLTLRESFWFNVCTGTWSAKTYGTTFLVAALDGPVTAGTFFVLLRLSEIISGLGAISSDVSLGTLAQVRSTPEHRASFASSYGWAVILCSHLALTLGFGSRDFLSLWLHSINPMPALVGLVVAVLGLASAFNRTATYAAMALGQAKPAARWGLVEASSFLSILALLALRHSSLLLQLGLATCSVAAMLPLARKVSHRLSSTSTLVWLAPFRRVIGWLVLSATFQAGAYISGWSAGKLGATMVAGILCLLNLLAYSRATRPAAPESLPAGFSTSSLLC